MKNNDDRDPVTATDRQIILNLENIAKRAQQIAAIAIVLGFMGNWFYHYAVALPLQRNDERDNAQDKKIELILETLQKREASDFELKQSVAVLSERFTRFDDSLTAIRKFLEQDYKRR